ncbi:MAG: GlmU family protein [Melioribacter sp.]|uniref:GlmU family protein n=1 Tax=Rosettibacter primus TaxID=3111523 RepID=UPI00247D73E2|nr:GlmU family protein [Melioribacter sp.]
MKSVVMIYEDTGFKNLLPLTFLRPVYELKCGILTLKQKLELFFLDSKIIFHCRPYLENTIKEKYQKSLVNDFKGNSILFVNGRLLINKEVADKIKNLKEGIILSNDNQIVAVKIKGNNFNYVKFNDDGSLSFDINNLSKENTNAKLINYLWDLVNYNCEEIVNDYKLIIKNYREKKSKVNYKSVETINKKNIVICKGTKIEPFVLLDASEGPIFIDENVHIMSHTTIKGPAFIGKNSLIKAHTSIYHNTTIGEVCKIGGEIENSIFHSFSNKQHEGFIGHSYIGSWVNLGAGTTNSDLKNDYGIVDVFVNNEKIKTGNRFIGLFMGDYSKTAIGTVFNTGTVVGISCNIFGHGFPPKYIPSFTWGGVNNFDEYKIDKAIEVAKIVASRRNVYLTENDINLLKKIFELTESERKF